jgi:hypothetical protein
MRRNFRPTPDGLEAKTLLSSNAVGILTGAPPPVIHSGPPLQGVPRPVGVTTPLTPGKSPANLGTLQGLTGSIVGGSGFPGVAVPSGPYHEVAHSPAGAPLAVVPHSAVPYV